MMPLLPQQFTKYKWIADRFEPPVIIALLLASISLNVILARRIDSLNKIVEIQAAKGRPSLVVGDLVSALTIIGPDKSRSSLSLLHHGKPTLIYVVAPTCHWCRRNLKNVLALEEALAGGYDFIGISPTSSGLSEYVLHEGVRFPVYHADLAVGSKVIASVTPQTIVINERGVVETLWEGAYSGIIQTQIEEKFGVRLPGLTPEAALE